MKNYLLILDDWVILHTDELCSSDIDSCKEGIMSIVRLNDLCEMNTDGDWVEILKADDDR